MTTRDLCSVSERKSLLPAGAEDILSSSNVASYPDLVIVDIYGSLEQYNNSLRSIYPSMLRSTECSKYEETSHRSADWQHTRLSTQ
jgi:hypothetical protein